MLTVNQGEQYVISPITGEKVPASSISSHTKYCKNLRHSFCKFLDLILILALLDPNWIQRREKEMIEAQEREQIYEPGKMLIEHLIDNLLLSLSRCSCRPSSERSCQISYRYFRCRCTRSCYRSKSWRRRSSSRRKSFLGWSHFDR